MLKIFDKAPIQPILFKFHGSDVPHTVVIGPTGKGMSTAEEFEKREDSALQDMAPLNEKEQALQQTAEVVCNVVAAMKKSGLLPVLPQHHTQTIKRVRALLQLLAFQDDGNSHPREVRENFSRNLERMVCTRLEAANMMLPTPLRHCDF